jgi:signal transduction histidine kinase
MSRAARAHALKNCLSTILAINRLLEREANEKSRERLRRSEDAVKRMLALIADDLEADGAASRSEDAFVSAEQIVRAVVARVGDRAEAGGVELFVQNGPGGLVGDAAALAEALGNIVLNAVEATQAGGAVLVATYECPDRSQLWTVQDTGRGIPAEMLPRIGIPFASCREGGTGLGLAVAHAVVEKHGGVMRIESPTGAGTLVSIRLPPLAGDIGAPKAANEFASA